MIPEFRPVVGAIAAASTLLTAGAAVAQAAPQSTAVGVDANLTSGGVSAELGPVAAVAGLPGGQFDSDQTVSRFNQSVVIGQQARAPMLSITGHGMSAHVSSAGVGVDSRGSEGDNALVTATLTLNVRPSPLLGAPTPVPALVLTTREVVSSANFNTVYPATTFATGATSIGALSISGALLGARKLSASGQIAPDTVIYESPTVTITLNRQIKSGAISCSFPGGCTFTLAGVDVAAVAIDLRDAVVGGAKVSGEILINDAQAR